MERPPESHLHGPRRRAFRLGYMRDRFTRRSRTTRGSIPKHMRHEVYRRDDRVCVYCGAECRAEELTIDHLIPLALGGLVEMTNWATCCRACNERKAAQPLEGFLESLAMPVEELPVYGDPVIDNPAIPMQLKVAAAAGLRPHPAR